VIGITPTKKLYQEASAEFERLIEQLIVSIGKFDTSIIQNVPKELTFKLVRDTRFSHDKSPYIIYLYGAHFLCG
jgi:uncharacterized protein (DUF2461 family)